MQEPLTLYKLIVLYMLDRVKFPLTLSQISEFILEKEYTGFLNLQQAIGELAEADMILTNSTHHRTLMALTEEGSKTLHYFENRIGEPIRTEIDSYIREKKWELKEEVSVLGDYYKDSAGEYRAHLVAKERDSNLVEITLNVPTEKMAASICDNWQKINQEIYEFLVRKLF